MRIEIPLMTVVLTVSVLSGCILIDEECEDEGTSPYDENYARSRSAHDPYDEMYPQEECKQGDYDPEPYARDR